jgi:YbgC/YbaW family acyl-CoA thioester hydrolase
VGSGGERRKRRDAGFRARLQAGGVLVADSGSDAPGYNRSFSMTPFSETRLRVRYAETDQMGVVYYANYLVWMEVGRVDLCKACGFSYRDMENDDGVLLAVAEAQCRYRAPAHFDDEVIVKTWIAEANKRMVTLRLRNAARRFGNRARHGHHAAPLRQPQNGAHTHAGQVPPAVRG